MKKNVSKTIIIMSVFVAVIVFIILYKTRKTDSQKNSSRIIEQFNIPWKALFDITDRQKCNLLNGCAPALKLRQAGQKIVPILCDYYFQAKSIRNQYSRWEIVKIIGKIKGNKSIDCLISICRDNYWQGVIPALFALGDLNVKKALPLIKTFSNNKKQGIGVQAAAYYALAKIENPKYAKKIEQILKNSKKSVLSWVYLRFVINAARRLNMKNLSHTIADYMKIPDYYLQREILETLQQFNDATVAPLIIIGLKSKFSYIKRKTLKLLHKFTHNYKNKTYDEWKKWFDN